MHIYIYIYINTYNKFARPLGLGRVRASTSIIVVNQFVDKGARARRALGAILPRRTPLPSVRPTPGPFFAALCRPGLTSIDFFAPQGHFKNRPIFGTLKIDPVGGKVAPWPPLGRQWFHFCYFFDPFWNPFFIVFSILFRTPQNLDFAIPYGVFEGFSHPKSSHFGTPFRSLFRTHFGTPFGRAL